MENAHYHFLDGVSLQSCRLYRIYARILIIRIRYAALTDFYYILEIITFYYE